MREFRFVLGRRVLIVFLALLIATGALLGVPAATQTLAESPLSVSQEASAVSADSVAMEGPLLGPPGHSPLLFPISGDIWTEKNTAKNPTTTPTMRYEHAMAATPSGNVLLFGGRDGSVLGDTWVFNTATNTWGQITGSSTPSARRQFAMAATPSGVLLFGGVGAQSFNDTWLFNTTTNTWGQITGSSTPPQLYDHAMAATPSGAVLFGGYGIDGFINQTWLFNAATNTWMQVAATGTRPSIRARHAMAATPSGNVLLFGGWDGSVLGDTWVFNTATNTWGLVDTGSASPSARHSHAMAATPSGNVLLFGGGVTGGIFNDTWLFNATDNTWGQITGSSTPPARAYHAMAATPSGVLLFGGQDSGLRNDTWLYGPITLAPTIAVTSPTSGAHWPIGSPREITWTSTDLNSTTLTVLLARDGVDFTETLTCGVDAGSTSWTWTVSGPGTINAKVRVQQDGTVGTSPGFFTIADAYPYNGTPTTTIDPWLQISGGGTETGTLWVTPLDPQYTSVPNLDQFLQATGQRAALFFDIRQENLTGILTIVLHFNHQLGEETFVLYRWDGAGWVKVDGTPNLVDHTFTFTIDASLLAGTPFALAGNPVAMPGMSPWALVLLSLALLGAGGWWFLRRRRLA